MNSDPKPHNPPHTRRDFLRGAFALSAGCLLPELAAPSTPLNRTQQSRRIVVIGAGLAGLVAAYELIRVGHDVTVLEARMRPGGRVLTLREPFADGMYAEAGALFIPDNHAHTLKYVREFGLPLAPISPRAFAEMFYVAGKRVIPRAGAAEDWPLDLKTDERTLGHQGIWQRYIGEALNKLIKVDNPAGQSWPPESLKPLDQITFADFLKQQGASDGAVALLRLGYLDLFGDGVETSSALAILRDSALRLTEQKVYHIKGGNDQLPKAFAQKMQENLRYGCPVVRIEHTSGGVSVIYSQAGTRYKLTADHVICAIPFSTLRKVEIEPVLSTTKRKAIEELPYTSVSRVFLQTRTKFWTAAGLPGMTNSDLPIMWTWEPTYDQPGPRGILESYAAGPSARKITGMKESERLSYVLEQMEKVYPGTRKNYEGGASKCWDEDEWSQGDYAWFKPGQVVSLLPHIARAEGRIHFAGEHASAWPGWMQGALDSGLRAAHEIS